MNTVIIYENPMSGDEYKMFDVENVGEFLQEQYPVWPECARIYLDSVSLHTDVTPYDQRSTEEFEKMTGTFHVVIYPNLPIAIIIAIVIGVVAVGLAFLLRPKSSANLKNNQQTSPNNSLSNRSNQSRPGQRIPDIAGQVVSIPDDIMVPYRIFINSQEVEIAYLCIGVGKYTVTNAQDDVTPLAQIAGASAQVYDPYTSPNSGDAPTFTVGTPINRKVVSVQQCTAVNGQTLLAPNANTFTGTGTTTTFGPDNIQNSDTTVDYTKYFQASENIVLSSASVGGHDFSGNYSILSVTSSEIVLANPATVNSAWGTIATGTRTAGVNCVITATGINFIGPFYLTSPGITEIICNIVAENGLYKDDGTNQYGVDITVEMEVYAVDNTNTPVGSPRYFDATVPGSSTVRSTRAVTMDAILPIPAPVQIKMRRISATDITFKGTVVDSVQWRDCYAVTPVSQTNFGNITTVQTQTYATEGALSIKSRKLNFLVTRWVQQRKTVGGVLTYVPGTDNMAASTNAADIMMHFALDPYNGNRAITEIDWQGIYTLLGPGGTVETYFGTNLCSQFGYTFDDSNVSFEELFTDICNAVFCFPYRRGGNLLGITFEKLTTNSTILFNHRNKVPGSETRTFTFGMSDNSDGIELSYINPNAANYPGVDTSETLYFPADRSSINPKQLTVLGCRNNVQATFLGWRYYQKLKYQNTTTQFEGLEEAELALPVARILVADNTRDDTIDGDVVGINGLVLTLSQPTTGMVVGTTYYIFLQHTDGSVQSIACTVLGSFTVTLASAPALPLVNAVNQGITRSTGYMIGVAADASLPRSQAFLLSENTPENKLTRTIKAYNYDARYYAHDLDFINGILVSDAAPSGSTGFPAPPASPTTGDPGSGTYTPGPGSGGGGTGDPFEDAY